MNCNILLIKFFNFDGMNIFRNISAAWLIHIFACLHVLVVLGCRLSGIDDELLLTILTMTMVLLICMKRGLNIEFSAASIIVVNIICFIFGSLGARVFAIFLSMPGAAHSLSTFLTTEIIGWSIMALTKFFNSINKSQKKLTDSPYFHWLIIAMFGIFFMRLGIVYIYSDGNLSETKASEVVDKLISNSFLIITLICLNILYIRNLWGGQKDKSGFASKILPLTAFFLLSSFLTAVITGLGLPFEVNRYFREEFPLLFVTSLIMEITIYCLVFMVNFAITSRSKMKEEREKANLAEYRYIKLKHQVSPHFLFNSLNILDCLICEGEKERASTYTHKLAGIYRYMLKSENEMLVSLRDELVFVNLYIDLLKERFPNGIEFTIYVPEEYLDRYILSCSLQLLIENAIKHNAINGNPPLNIRIEITDGSIRVTNNIIPKLTQTASTGLGQTYIRHMYMDLTGKQILIKRNEDFYKVILPLI